MNLVIIGAGGLAREVFDLAVSIYHNDVKFKIKGFLSDGPSSIEEMGYPPVLNTVSGYEIEEGDVFFCAIGNVNDRKKTVEIILRKGGKFINLIHESVIISPSAKIGEGVAIKANCTIASDCAIGNFTYIQGTVILGHDVVIGNFCQVNSFSFFAGYTQIGDCCTVNAGAKFIQNVKVGNNSVVGMGSVVIKNVEANTTVFGSPARKISE
jgi:sugar O-acyltransferase (sialic acid O-acetyltransferase NeuD family)